MCLGAGIEGWKVAERCTVPDAVSESHVTHRFDLLACWLEAAAGSASPPPRASRGSLGFRSSGDGYSHDTTCLLQALHIGFSSPHWIRQCALL